MYKKKIIKVIKIILIIFTFLFLFSVISLLFYWKTDPQSLCNRAGGFWGGVHGCDNYCDKTSKYCQNKMIFGCECGLRKCWDGKRCSELAK